MKDYCGIQSVRALQSIIAKHESSSPDTTAKQSSQATHGHASLYEGTTMITSTMNNCKLIQNGDLDKASYPALLSGSRKSYRALRHLPYGAQALQSTGFHSYSARVARLHCSLNLQRASGPLSSVSSETSPLPESIAIMQTC